MSKCRVQPELVKIFECLIQDIARILPSLAHEFERDLERVRILAEARGVHLFCVDLPAQAKHLDRCLDDGQYVASRLPLGGTVSRTVQIPKLFRGLYLLIFSAQDGSILESPNVTAIRALRQLLCFAKKADLECSEEKKAAAVATFIDTDTQLPDPPQTWGGTGPCIREDGQPATFADIARAFPERGIDIRFAKRLDTVSGILVSTLGQYDYREWRFRHGPGAVAETTSKKFKYDFENWSPRLDSHFPFSDCAVHNWMEWAATSETCQMTEDEIPSRMVSVRKTYKAPRLIACEPSEHMWCQQNIWHYFSERSERTWISKFVRFHDQSLNQDLCRRGSVDGSLATLDLNEASDRVTPIVVEAMFRANPALLNALMASRTRSVTLPNGVVLPLRKFSTMGSACTFPVESLVFLAIAIASSLEGEVTTKRVLELAGRLSVFGDDIVVPVERLGALSANLESLWFKVNSSKTFTGKRFRESCGVDAFVGEEVTPTYWHRTVDKTDAESIASTVATHNNFLKRDLVTVASYLASTIHNLVDYVPMDSGAFGLYAPVGSDKLEYISSRCAWEPGLQQMQIRLRTLQSVNKWTETEGSSALLQYFTERPAPHIMWRHGYSRLTRPLIRSQWVSVDDIFRRSTGEEG